MKRKDSILANFYYQDLSKAKEGGNYFNKYKVPQNTTPEYRNDPILKFFNGGFMMPAQEGGNINFPKERGYTPPRMANGGNMNAADDKKPKRNKTTEQKVNNWLGDPMGKSFKKADEVGESWYNPKTKRWEKEQVDNFRHPMAGRYTAEAIANKFPGFMQYTSLPKVAGFVGANLLGIGHEVMEPNRNRNYSLWEKIREGGEDAFNNMVGAGIGSLPFISDKQKTEAIKYLSDNNLLPDGHGRGNAYFKQHGGDISIADLTKPNWLKKFVVGGGNFENPKKGLTTGFEQMTGIKPITSLNNRSESTSAGAIDRRASANYAAQKGDEAENFVQNYQKKYPGISREQAMFAFNASKKSMENQGEIKKASPKRSTASKALAIATNPMTALAYKVKGQDIPENFDRGERNILENAVDIVNPFSYIEQARQVKNNLGEGNYLGAAIGTLGLIPGEGSVAERVLGRRLRPSISIKNNTLFGETLDNPNLSQREFIKNIEGPSGMQHEVGYQNYPKQSGYDFQRSFGMRGKDDKGYLKFDLWKEKGNDYSELGDFSFFNPDKVSASDHIKMLMGNLPKKVSMPAAGDERLFSMYSQPIINANVSRLAGTPGRITIKPTGKSSVLNTGFLEGPGDENFLLQASKQFPRLQKSYKNLSQYTGTALPEPRMYLDNKLVTAEDLLSPDLQKRILDNKFNYVNPEVFRIEVPDYSIQKHFEQGGWLSKYDDGGLVKAQDGFNYQMPNYQMPRAVSESTSFGRVPMMKNAKAVTNKIDQNTAAIANYKKANPWATGKSDSEILGLIEINKNSTQNQGTIKKASPKRSVLSKTAAIVSNPMTALEYKIKGQDIPDNFEKGDRNRLDMALDVFNPATYIHAGGRTLENISQPFTTSARLLSGTGQLLGNIVGDGAGWDKTLDAAGIVGDAAIFAPAVSSGLRGVNAARKQLLPFVRGAQNTYKLTGDLPFIPRVKNALNAGTTRYTLDNIDNSEYLHHFFGSHMTPEDALNAIKTQKASAPAGALMGDMSMSLNSTPLYFQSAARDVKGFPVVRTGEYQNVNAMGFKGKRISQSIPDRVYTEYPEIIENYNARLDRLKNDFAVRTDRINNDVTLSEAEKQLRTKDLNRIYKNELSNITPERDAINIVQQNPSLFNEFSANYKPHIDASIGALSERTGLNFPGFRSTTSGGYPTWEAPTAYSVKGGFGPRYKAIGNLVKDAFKKEFNPNLRIKTGQNTSAADDFERMRDDIDIAFNRDNMALNSEFLNGAITEDELNSRITGLYMDRNAGFDALAQKYPSGKPNVETRYLEINPTNFAAPGIMNNVLGIKPSKTEFGNFNLRTPVNNFIKTYKKTFNEVNPQGYRYGFKYGGQSWLSKYPAGGPVASPAPTVQTGSPTQYGPTFSNQAGYTPAETGREKRQRIFSDVLKFGVFAAGVADGFSKKPNQTQTQQKQTGPGIVNLDVDGNGNPLTQQQKFEKGINLNYNPNMQAQDVNDPFAPTNPVQNQFQQNAGSSMSMARRGGDVSIYGRRNYKSDTPTFFKNGGSTNWLSKYEEGGGPGDDEKKTLLKDKKVGVITQPIKQLNLRPIFPSDYLTDVEIVDPNCPDPSGVGCSYQATREAQKITGLPFEAYAPADAGYRDAVAERYGLQNIFNQEGKQKKDANSGDKSWKYPTEKDFSTWKAGDIVVLDAPGMDYFEYNAPPGFSESDNTGASHNGVVVGFTKEGRPVIRHGYATGEKGKGQQITEVLGQDNRVTALGHGRYAVKSVWRPKEVNEEGSIQSVKPLIDRGSEQASRKEATYFPASFGLKQTYEERLMNEVPVAAAFTGATSRLNTKNNLVNLFNNSKLDNELQYQLGIDSKTLQNLKPVVYGIAGQETNFNDVDNPLASMKDVPGNMMNTGNSKGLFQIKYDSLTEDERKLLGIESPKDLLNDEKSYKAAILLMHNAKKRMDAEVEEGTHPGLTNVDPYFRAAYYYNSPARAVSTSKQWARGNNPVVLYNPTTWLNPIVTRERPNVFGSINPDYAEKIELRMDKGSYPYKLMEKANDLLMSIDQNQPEIMEGLVVRSAKKGSKIKLNNND